MYGTVARNRFKPGKREEFMRSMQEVGNRPPGAVQLLVCLSDSDPNEAWVAVAFESKEVYQANARSPEMNERYQQMMEFMESEPQWHDGEVLTPWS